MVGAVEAGEALIEAPAGQAMIEEIEAVEAMIEVQAAVEAMIEALELRETLEALEAIVGASAGRDLQ